jgi:hypothetical protein
VARRAYGEIGRRLLAGAPGNVPPAIRFADLRRELDGTRAELVRAPEYHLSGVALDSSPVTLTLEVGRERLAVTASSQPLGELFVTEFRASRRLPPGETTFALVATDSGGLSSRAEYVVVYARPWFRSPWVFAAAALLSLGGVAALLARRENRRRRRLRRRFNPYVAGGPVFDEELFFGRERLLQRILQTLHTNSLLLHGERRIGKTTLLHQLRRRLEALEDPEYRFHAVYVDLQGTPEERLFATLADQAFDALGDAAGIAGRTPAGERAAYDHHDLARELQVLVAGLQRGSDKRVKLVLLVDEIDELNHYDPRVNQRLRSLFMKRFAEDLAAVVAGVHIRRQWEQETSPWYNFFEEVAVEPLSPQAVVELVMRPIRGTFQVAPGVAERIATASGGRPYLVQRWCLELVNRLHDEGRRTIELADVEAVAGAGAAIPAESPG